MNEGEHHSTPEVEAQQLREALRHERQALIDTHGSSTEYQSHLAAWGEKLLELARQHPAQQGVDQRFEIELPGDFLAVRYARAAAQEWLYSANLTREEKAVLYEQMLVFSEMINNEFEHGLELGEPAPETGVAQQSFPERSVFLGTRLYWRDNHPILEIELRSDGKVAGKDIWSEYFTLEERGAPGAVELNLRPRPSQQTEEDVVLGPQETEVDLDKLLADTAEGGRGMLLMAEHAGSGEIIITTPAEVPGETQKAKPTPHTVLLRRNLDEQLVAA